MFFPFYFVCMDSQSLYEESNSQQLSVSITSKLRFCNEAMLDSVVGGGCTLVNTGHAFWITVYFLSPDSPISREKFCVCSLEIGQKLGCGATVWGRERVRCSQRLHWPRMYACVLIQWGHLESSMACISEPSVDRNDNCLLRAFICY
jgi:hypothetical protein